TRKAAEVAEQEAINCQSNQSAANERYKQVKDRKQAFEQVATEPQCSLCGQPITREHARREGRELEKAVTEAEGTLQKAKEASRAAVQHQKRCTETLQSAQDQQQAEQRELTKIEQQASTAESAQKTHTEDLAGLFEQLPERYQTSIRAGLSRKAKL